MIKKFFSVLILFFLMRAAASNAHNVNRSPKGVQAFMEPLILFVRDDIIKSNIGPKYEMISILKNNIDIGPKIEMILILARI